MTSFSTDTAEFSHLLKKKSHHEDVETLARTVTNGAEENFDPKKGITSKQFHHLAYRMAKKSYEDDYAKNFTKPNASPGLVAVRRKVEERKAKGGRGFQITSATAHYVGDLAVTGAKGELHPTVDVRCSLIRFKSSGCSVLQPGQRVPQLPIVCHQERPGETARRDYQLRQRLQACGKSITLCLSGCDITLTVSQELVFGIGDAFVGTVRHPYLGAKQEGPIGFGKGVGRGFAGFFFHFMAGG
jgi:sterol 3beta-glucosyltransferase